MYHPMVHQTKELKMSKPCSFDGENPNLMHHNFPFFMVQPKTQFPTQKPSNMGHVRQRMLDFVIPSNSLVIGQGKHKHNYYIMSYNKQAIDPYTMKRRFWIHLLQKT